MLFNGGTCRKQAGAVFRCIAAIPGCDQASRRRQSADFRPVESGDDLTPTSASTIGWCGVCSSALIQESRTGGTVDSIESFVYSTQGMSVAEKTLPHGERREQVVQAILDRLVSGELRGGDRLVTQELVDELNVSATPVREALAVLGGLGVIDLLPNRGAVVHQFSSREIRDICRVRRALECEAVRGACGRIPPSALRKLETDLKKLAESPVMGKRAIRRAKELDTQLHDLIRDCCANQFLQSELLRLSHLFRSFRDASWIDSGARDDCDRLKEEAEEHLQVVRALRDKDKRAASAALSKHIRAAARYWSRLG